jgi:enoyl-CoA hydratase
MPAQETVTYEAAEPPKGWADEAPDDAPDRPVRVLTIDRPEVRNCVDPATAEGLRSAVQDFADADDAYILVVTGAGDDAFSSGADLEAWGEVIEQDEMDVVPEGEGPLGFTHEVDVGKPTIAAVNGYCLAGGVEIAAWCDMRIAERDARFGLPNRQRNVILADGGTQRLPRLVGQGRAMELVLTGRPFDVREAYEMGFVNEIVGQGESTRRALDVAHHVAAAPQDALRADRRALLDGLGRPLEEGLALERENLGIYAHGGAAGRTRDAIDDFLEG